MFKPVLVVPFYNHLDAFSAFAPKLSALNLPIVVVNDGSAEQETVGVKQICEKYKFVYQENAINQGKGGAVKKGLLWALENGFTHALQIDSDGQHDINDVPAFLQQAEKNLNCIINGAPVYDATAPKSRLIGRKITNFWVVVETRGFHITDAMCGFRVYPLTLVCPILSAIKFNRMGFDIEILVKSYLLGIDIFNQPTKVIYPENGVSHFHALRDNFFISCLHTHLFFWSLIHLFRRKKK